MHYGEYLARQVAAIKDIQEDQLEELAQLLRIITSKGGRIFLVGNGGSGSNASHAACDFAKGVFQETDIPFETHSFNDAVVAFSAWINDFDPLDVYVNLARSQVKPGDLIIMISGSGDSENLIRLGKYLLQKKIHAFSLLGSGGGKIGEMPISSIIVSSSDMQIIENTHLYIIHWVYKYLSGQSI